MATTLVEAEVFAPDTSMRLPVASLAFAGVLSARGVSLTTSEAELDVSESAMAPAIASAIASATWVIPDAFPGPSENENDLTLTEHPDSANARDFNFLEDDLGLRAAGVVNMRAVQSRMTAPDWDF